MIEIRILPLGMIQTNCYVVTCQETGATAVIDPGDDGRGLSATLTDQGLDLTHILITHAHFDHVGGLAQLKEEHPQVPIYIHREAAEMLPQVPMQAALWGVRLPPDMPPADHYVNHGDTITVGRLQFKALYTPGHAIGHIAFYEAQQGILFSGDALFQGSIGRTDLPGSDHARLLRSLREEILPLPDATHVLSGHGGATTIGDERAKNPFLSNLA